MRHRYFNRNIVGDNDLSGNLQILQVQDPLQKYNTVSIMLKVISGGLVPTWIPTKTLVSPMKNRGQIYYFDINLEGLVATDETIDSE